MLGTLAFALVKKIDSGVCHDENSRIFLHIKNYTSYPTLSACLKSGGIPFYSTTSTEKLIEDYSRDKFGSGWLDVDSDGQDTRQEILIAQNTGNIVFNTKGRVIRGRWVSMYSGQIIVNASKVDIDHIVPLSWAWKHGANQWSESKRERFANDPINLLAVEASLNRQKGDRGPEEWLPPKNQNQYKLRFARVIKTYGLM
jgi:hypothetical protein